jgi:hypothetical protein
VIAFVDVSAERGGAAAHQIAYHAVMVTRHGSETVGDPCDPEDVRDLSVRTLAHGAAVVSCSKSSGLRTDRRR